MTSYMKPILTQIGPYYHQNPQSPSTILNASRYRYDFPDLSSYYNTQVYRINFNILDNIKDIKTKLIKELQHNNLHQRIIKSRFRSNKINSVNSLINVLHSTTELLITINPTTLSADLTYNYFPIVTRTLEEKNEKSFILKNLKKYHEVTTGNSFHSYTFVDLDSYCKSIYRWCYKENVDSIKAMMVWI